MTAAPSPYDQARDELFQHVIRCGVIGSAPEHQAEWFDETMKYLAERYHELNERQVKDLRVLGERFAAPTARSIAAAAQAAEIAEDGGEESEGTLDAVNAA